MVRGRRRRGGILLVLGLAACHGAGEPPPVAVPNDREELRRTLAEIADRRDMEASLARARIYARLRELEGTSPELLGRGDGADLEVLSQPSPIEYKLESAARLARNFRERGRRPELCRTALEGPAAGALRRFVLFTAAAWYGEYVSRAEHARALDGLSEAAQEISRLPELRAEARGAWDLRARQYALRAEDLRAADAPRSPSPEARAFCERDLARHLEEAARTADQATRERADRGDPERVLEGYLASLTHYVVVRECLWDAGSAQERRLDGMGLVARCVTDLLCR